MPVTPRPAAAHLERPAALAGNLHPAGGFGLIADAPAWPNRPRPRDPLVHGCLGGTVVTVRPQGGQ